MTKLETETETLSSMSYDVLTPQEIAEIRMALADRHAHLLEMYHPKFDAETTHALIALVADNQALAEKFAEVIMVGVRAAR